MAIGTPTAKGSGTSTTNNATVTATLATGSANRWIIGIAAKRDNVAATGTFSGAGLTWTTVDFNNGATTGGVHVGWALDAAGSASGTVTFTWSSSAVRKGISLWEVTGLDLTAPHDAIDTANSGTSGNASVTAGSVTAQADEIIFFVSKHNAASGTVTGTPSVGYTELDDFIVGASTWMQQYSSYKIASATETPSPSVTFTDTTTNWQAGVIAFKAAGGSPPATTIYQLAALGVG